LSSSGKKQRLKGQGFKASDGTAGDMIVELMIKLPEQVPAAVIQSLSELEKAYSRPVREGVQL
jgi:curved DNA-binding protein